MVEQPSRDEKIALTSSRHTRKRYLVVLLVFLAVVGLAVGLGVGLTRRHHTTSPDNDHEEGDDDNSRTAGSGAGNSTAVPSAGSHRTSMWQPLNGTTWQIVLKDPITQEAARKTTPDVDVFDLDMWENTPDIFEALHRQGKKVICYFSAGSYEEWRPDKDDFGEEDLGKPLDGWPGERWINVSSPSVREIMGARIRMAAGKGCDAIDPDNVDGYQNENGLDLTRDDAIQFVQFLSRQASQFNMSAGLKNAGDIIGAVLPFVAFSVNEQCVEYSECSTFKPFISQRKPVFNIEYPSGAPGDVTDSQVAQICSGTGKAQGSQGFSHIVKDLDLDGWAEYCNGMTYTTATVDAS